jgi:hypothetical protein
MASLDEARAARDKVAARFADHPLLNGVGIARVPSGFGVKLNFARRPDGVRLPDCVDGVPLEVDVIGEIKKQAV